MEKLTNERFAEIIRDKEICEFCEDCGYDEICICCKKVKPATVNELRSFWKELSALVKARDEGPCGLCRYNPPSSCDGKPCTMCPAEAALGGGGDG